jgi:predicted MFS family arabinose efflux permease
MPSPNATANAQRLYWTVTLVAATIMMVTMGMRQSQGLFVSPLNTATGLGIVAVSFAMAIGQFTWGAIQPIAGAIADKYGPGRVLAIGLIVLAVGYAITPYMKSEAALAFSIGLLIAAGTGAGSFSVLMGAANQRLPAEQRGMASGIINAGGSFGQFVFAPIVQKLISSFGWMGAMWAMAALSLAALPLARMLRGQPKPPPAADAPVEQTMRSAIKESFKDRSYLLLHAGFFTCGFHIAFLITHLPGEVQLCGLPPSVASWSVAIIGLANIAGSLAVGWGVQKVRSKMILFWMYFSRALIILAYLAAPKTDITFYFFAFGLGATWLATVPPTAALVGKLFGVRYLSTLFGLTLLSHQIGGFFGAWLGGLDFAANGTYQWMWFADIALALIAAVCNLPIREAKISRPAIQPA